MLSHFLLLVLAGCQPSVTADDDAKPATSNVARALYPRIHPDRRVTFWLRAGDSKEVKVQPGGADNGLGKGPYAMEKDKSGNWTVTTPPAVPGFHYYWLLVDGIAVNDPGSETYFVKTMHENLEKAGIKHVVFESPGTSHEWQTWRRSLHDFAPRLFR
jgi:hypothetical protein